jgi:hypothetical protein
MAIPSSFLHAIDIVDVAEKLTTGVQRTSDGGRMLCPAHSEKTPSCYLRPDGHFKCFGGGCGAWGDQVDLVRLLRGCTFGEALDWLAETYNLPRPERDPQTEARERARKVIRETLAAGLAAAVEDGTPLPFGLDADLAGRLGLGHATDLAGSLEDIDQAALSLDEIRRWEGAWTIEMHVRGGLSGFGALLPVTIAKAVSATIPKDDTEEFEPEPSEDSDTGDSEDSGDYTDASEDATAQVVIDDVSREISEVTPESTSINSDATEDNDALDVLTFERARSMRTIAFAGLSAARDVINRSGAAIVTPDVSEMLELQASNQPGLRGTISPGLALQTPGVAKALATITGRVVVVVTPQRRSERGFAAAMFALVAEGLRVDLAVRTPDGLAKPKHLSAYLRTFATTLDERQQSALLGAFIRSVPSASSRQLYQADFRAAGLKA